MTCYLGYTTEILQIMIAERQYLQCQSAWVDCKIKLNYTNGLQLLSNDMKFGGSLERTFVSTMFSQFHGQLLREL
jgi:hypothetical protein